MHITILALGSRGDIQPYARLGKGLQSAGHRVCFVTAKSFESTIASQGLGFCGIPGDARAIVHDAGASMPALIRAFSNLSRGFALELPRLTPILRETDIILNQLPGGLYGYDLAERFQVPMILVAVMPLTRTSTFPMIGWPTRFAPIPGYNRLSYWVAEQIVWQMFRPMINRWRTAALGLPKSRFRGYFNQLHDRRVPVLNGFSAHFVPRPPDWDDCVHLTGYWYPEDRAWQAPDGLRRFIDDGRPPVFIGFGSMPVRQPKRTTKLILSALEQCDQRAILHAGWSGLGDYPLPDHVLRIDYAPYEWLFPRMAAVVHHGGSGTTAFGLRAGVPALIVPFLFDQFYWGGRIAALGVGPAPIPYRRLSARRLAEAIALAIAAPQMRQRAAALGQQIRAEDGIAKAIRVIEQSAT